MAAKKSTTPKKKAPAPTTLAKAKKHEHQRCRVDLGMGEPARGIVLRTHKDEKTGEESVRVLAFDTRPTVLRKQDPEDPSKPAAIKVAQQMVTGLVDVKPKAVTFPAA